MWPTDSYLYSQSCEIHRLGPSEFILIDLFPYMSCNSVKSIKFLHVAFRFLFSIQTDNSHLFNHVPYILSHFAWLLENRCHPQGSGEVHKFTCLFRVQSWEAIVLSYDWTQFKKNVALSICRCDSCVVERYAEGYSWLLLTGSVGTVKPNTGWLSVKKHLTSGS